MKYLIVGLSWLLAVVAAAGAAQAKPVKEFDLVDASVIEIALNL